MRVPARARRRIGTGQRNGGGDGAPPIRPAAGADHQHVRIDPPAERGVRRPPQPRQHILHQDSTADVDPVDPAPPLQLRHRGHTDRTVPAATMQRRGPLSRAR